MTTESKQVGFARTAIWCPQGAPNDFRLSSPIDIPLPALIDTVRLEIGMVRFIDLSGQGIHKLISMGLIETTDDTTGSMEIKLPFPKRRLVGAHLTETKVRVRLHLNKNFMPSVWTCHGTEALVRKCLPHPGLVEQILTPYLEENNEWPRKRKSNQIETILRKFLPHPGLVEMTVMPYLQCSQPEYPFDLNLAWKPSEESIWDTDYDAQYRDRIVQYDELEYDCLAGSRYLDVHVSGDHPVFKMIFFFHPKTSILEQQLIRSGQLVVNGIPTFRFGAVDHLDFEPPMTGSVRLHLDLVPPDEHMVLHVILMNYNIMTQKSGVTILRYA